MTENYLLEVKNVSKSFGVVKALNRIDFNVRPNEIHALCGENGAGKSTLIAPVCQLLQNRSRHFDQIDGRKLADTERERTVAELILPRLFIV